MPRSVFTRVMVLCVFTTLLAAATSARAANNQPSVIITSLAHSEVIWPYHPGYDPADETLVVSGKVEGINKPQDYSVWVQGMLLPVTELNGEFFFYCELPIGPTPPGYPVQTQWPFGWPDVASYENPYKVYLPIMAQLRDIGAGQVVSRHRIVVRDVRFYDPLTFHTGYTTPMISDGLAAQITPAGVAQLQPVHEDSLPYPDMAALDAALQIHVDNIPSDTRQFTNGDGLCVDLYDGHPLTQTAAYDEAHNEAVHYLAILAACSSGQAGTLAESAITTLLSGPVGAIAGVTMQTLIALQCSDLCVADPLITASDFKACVGEVSGKLTDVDVLDVKKATLELTSSSGKLESVVKVGALQGDVRVELSDIWIRWHRDGCNFRPKGELDVWDLADIAAWRTCEDLSIEAQNHRTANNLGDPYPIVFSVAPGDCPGGGGPDECVDASMAASAPFLLHDNQTTVAANGTCGEPELYLTVLDILEDFYDDMAMVAENGWYYGGADMYQGQALDGLFKPLGVGSVPVDDHVIEASIMHLESGLNSGLYLDYRTEVPRGPFSPLSWLYPEPSYPPPVSPDGVARTGQDFSISYTISTGFLNQILRALRGTWRLNKDYTLLQLVFASLGKTPKVSNDTLNAVKYLINQGVRIRLYPTLTPIAYLPSDQGNVPVGDFPLYYEGAHFIIDLYKELPGKKAKKKDLVLLQISVDFWDFEFSLLPPPANGASAGFMDAGFGDDNWTFNLLRSTLPGCPLGSPCEAQLLDTLEAWLLPYLRAMTVGLLSQVPAPLHFDAEGAAATSRNFELIDVWSGDQQITYYGDLVN